MPPLTMRGRYIMREYWTDSALFLRLTPAERELYIGLWMLADDEGWIPRDVPAIAASLYRYEDQQPREAKVSAGLQRLRSLGKVQTARCCLFLPVVARYPRAGKKSNEHGVEHRRHNASRIRTANAKPIQTANASRIQTHSGPSPVPSLPDPTVTPARARGSRRASKESGAPSEFSQRVPRPPGGEP